MDIPFIDESLKRVAVPEFRRDLIVSQNSKWMIVKGNRSVEEYPKLWTTAYAKSLFAKIE
jgi:hypothetical protein